MINASGEPLPVVPGETPEEFALRYFGEIYSCEHSGNIAMVEDAFKAGVESFLCWQPIETAPADTRILLWIERDQEVRIGEIWPRQPRSVMPDRTAYLDGADMAETVYPDHAEYPTHWMPLPGGPPAR